jgi:hypothetical protein
MNSLEKAQSIAASLPNGVRLFALNEDYWDPEAQLCPHDGWLEEVVVREIIGNPISNAVSEYERVTARQKRAVEISLRLLGWSHENILSFSYQIVSRYSIGVVQLSTRGNRAHGDWLEDSIDLAPSGRVLHKIRFSSGAEWIIDSVGLFRLSWEETVLLNGTFGLRAGIGLGYFLLHRWFWFASASR